MARAAFIVSATVFPLLLFFRLAAPAMTEITFDGFQYRLANPDVSDIETVDYDGDDCRSLPCPTYPLPEECVVSDRVPSNDGLGWAGLYLATAQSLVSIFPWTASYAGTRIVDARDGGVRLTESGWGARILLKCIIPCPRGMFLNGSVCSICPAATWGANNTCFPCTNAPLNAMYLGSGGTTNQCNFTCPANFYSQPKTTASLLIGDASVLRRLDTATNALTTLYTPPPGHPMVGFTSMTVSELDPRIVYVGLYSLHAINLTSGTNTRIAGGVTRATTDGIGTTAGFNSISAIRPWRNGTMLVVVDRLNCHMRTVDLRTLMVKTVAGTTACGYANGVGLAAQFSNPTDVVIGGDVAYVADSGNYRIRAVTMGSWNVTTLVGSGVGGTVNGIGTSALVDPRYLALSGNSLFVRSPGFLRRIDLTTLATTTVASLPYSGGVYPVAFGLPENHMLYYSADSFVGALDTNSFDAIPILGSTTRGAPFDQPSFVSVLGEAVSSTSSVCLRCLTCGPGFFKVCTTTSTACVPCPPGTASAAGGCRTCSAGTYSSPDRSTCAVCPLGTFSAQGVTRCANCSAGTYPSPLLLSTCIPCPNGTFATEGMPRCLPCTGLIPNATWNGGGISEGNCTFACANGYTLNPNETACSPCGPGNWSASGLCMPCDPPPNNASYVRGVGVAPDACPFQCNAGFVRSGSARVCIPCPAGTRMMEGATNCTNCSAGFYSGQGAVVCSTCGNGVYSLPGATACTPCQGANNPYIIYVGRGTSVACNFACRQGSYVFNSTTCVPCANGTFAPRLGITTCLACAGGTWSGLAATACVGCVAR